MQQESRKVFYGWYVVIGSSLVSLGVAGTQFSFGVGIGTSMISACSFPEITAIFIVSMNCNPPGSGLHCSALPENQRVLQTGRIERIPSGATG